VNYERAFPALEPRDRERAAQLGMEIHEFVRYRQDLRDDYAMTLTWPRSQFRTPLRMWMVPGCNAVTPTSWLNRPAAR
jgi:hypothetical protein